MGLFGLKSKKEIAVIERQARESEKQRVLQGQQTTLSNLAKGSQIQFRIPYFEVFDPRFENFGVPVAVACMLVYSVDDIKRFNTINKAQDINDGVFQQKLKGQVTKFVKSVVTNAPSNNRIPVLQLERRILEISTLVQDYVTPQIEKLFGINVRSIDITDITVDKESPGYRELKVVTTDVETDLVQAQASLQIDAMKRRQNLSLGGEEEIQRIQLEHQRETMRVQREEMQRASRLQTETNFLGAHQANLHAATQTDRLYASASGVPQMPGVPPIPGSVQYMIGIDGQQAGPFSWSQLQQLVQNGQLTQQTYVWKQGMPQWLFAGEVLELAPLFQTVPPQMPPIP